MTDIERTITKRVTLNGREYIEYSDSTEWTRKLDRTTGLAISEWTEVEKPPTDENEPPSTTRHLSVVAEHQADNEPKHWYLFSHIPNAMGTGAGQVWSVTGDAELMHYDHAEDVDRMSSEAFAWHQVLSKDLSKEQLARVDQIARTESPPSAPSRAAVTENCQGWAIRVLRRLVDEKIVEEKAVDILQKLMDPIN